MIKIANNLQQLVNKQAGLIDILRAFFIGPSKEEVLTIRSPELQLGGTAPAIPYRLDPKENFALEAMGIRTSEDKNFANKDAVKDRAYKRENESKEKTVAKVK